jgi:hypothetical protein
MVSIAPSNNAFAGGAQQRNLPPPTVGGGIASANTRVSAPVGGVNPGAIFTARNNEGSNIGVPYSRLTPLNNEQPLGKRSHDGSRKEMHSETQSLRATTLAFILGKRSKLPAIRADPVDGDRSQLHMMQTLMPGMPGTERFQALCSLEYLQVYFEQVCAKLQIEMGEPLSNILDKPNSVLGCPNGNPTLLDSDTLLAVQDFAKDVQITMPDSDMGKTSERLQGIFARDVGPFLRGKGIAQATMQTTTSNTTAVKDGAKTWMPCLRSRNSGDEMAFAALNKKMTDIGLLDWTPDGIVLSKGAEDPSDKLSDEYFNARDGQLFNIRVQGPAVGTTWTGDSSMETLPLDKVFVVIVADVWFNLSGEDEKVVNAFRDGTPPALKDGETKQKTAAQAYEDLRADKFLKEEVDTKEKELSFNKTGFAAFKGDKKEKTVLTNFRIELTTSSQIVNFSHMRHSAASRTVPGKRSRMGLKLTESFGEYIIGGWSIGSVMDTSASRSTFPSSGTTIGVRTAPNSAALNINVQIGYWDGDRLWRTFMNKEGTVKPRYEASKPGGPQLPMNKPLSKDEVASATVESSAAAKAARAQARDRTNDETVGEERPGDQDLLGAISAGNPQNVQASAAGGIARAANLAAARVAAGNASNR